MKVLFSRILSAIALFSLVLVTGCAIVPPTAITKNEAARLSTAVATPGLDGVAVTVAVLDVQEINPATGENTGVWKRITHLFNSLPVAGQALVGATSGVGAALIQREAAKDVARINCGAGGCGGSGGSGAQSGSASQAVTNVNVNVGAPCTSTACTGR